MNIKILDSWVKDFLKTDATAQEIAEKLSLTSVSIERVEKYKKDWLYDIEIMTNRPDLASVIGLAREAGAVLPQNGIKATYHAPEHTIAHKSNVSTADEKYLHITNDPKLVNRICAVVMEVKIKESPEYVKDRLESSDIRSLNNVIDITNYVMRTIGHPAHVFDYDRLGGKKMLIRESKKGEKIQTLDGKTYTLPGGDLVADDGTGRIIDLLGIMGLENSVVTDETKRILFFIDNNETTHIRKTSMTLGIRTEAAQLNEKGLDPELAMDALLYGIKLYEDLADGKVLSKIIDIYPNKPEEKTVTVSEEKINTVIGVNVPLERAKHILDDLGLKTTIHEKSIEVIIPTVRTRDMSMPEDIIEEIARVYGYHNLPNELPPFVNPTPYRMDQDEFYWERRVKEAMKYWGFTEIYTYSMVSEDMFEGPLEDAVKIANPLSEDMMYMRRTLVPSLLQTVAENKKREKIRIYEIANVYLKKQKDLPIEMRKFAGVIKQPKLSFFEVKGLLEQIFTDLKIEDVQWKSLDNAEVEISIGKEKLGEVEILDAEIINFELDFEHLIAHATRKNVFTPLSKYPPVIEDMAIIAPESVTTAELIQTIEKQSKLISEVSLLDRYKDSRTFHIIYQNCERNLTNEDITPIREKIMHTLKEKYHARLKQ